VILTRRIKNIEHPNQPDIVASEVALANIRVLAIDQAPKEKDGQNAVIGKTVTLELKPDQIPVLTSARQAGTLSLALRSIADVKMVENIPDNTTVSRGVSIIRFGVPSSGTLQK
jgi:pilus assembly protein CpaB